jgi:hypothetical protein
MNTPLVLGFLSLDTRAAGGQGDESTTVPADAKVNAGSAVTESTSDRPAGRADAEEPETGTNSGRPDAPRDLKPGTDGNTNPPPR